MSQVGYEKADPAREGYFDGKKLRLILQYLSRPASHVLRKFYKKYGDLQPPPCRTHYHSLRKNTVLRSWVICTAEELLFSLGGQIWSVLMVCSVDGKKLFHNQIRFYGTQTSSVAWLSKFKMLPFASGSSFIVELECRADTLLGREECGCCSPLYAENRGLLEWLCRGDWYAFRTISVTSRT